MPDRRVSGDEFWALGHTLTRHDLNASRATGYRRFRAMFGTSPLVCSALWTRISPRLPNGSSPIHLLWALLFLKRYDTEHANRIVTGADEKTFRKRTWAIIDALADVDVVRWDDRFQRACQGDRIFVSLDGTDFRIREPTPFNRKWYSHKFHGPGVRYEIGLCIRTGRIVWAHGGVPCGDWPDLKLARDAYTSCVRHGELTLADKGYRDASFFVYPGSRHRLIRNSLRKRIMARHETVNRRLKQFEVLGQCFRHPLHRHPRCFHAVVNVTQEGIDHGEPLFGVDVGEAVPVLPE